MSVVSVSMPDKLVEDLDEFADDHGYTGRSEVVRESARNLLGEFEDERLEDQRLAGVVTVLFDYGLSTVEQQLLHLHHEHDSLVVSNNHSHVDDHYCMELFVLDGSIEDISGFIRKIRSLTDIRSVDHLFVPTEDATSLAAENERPLPG